MPLSSHLELLQGDHSVFSFLAFTSFAGLLEQLIVTLKHLVYCSLFSSAISMELG